jgi:hypothetical protein
LWTRQNEDLHGKDVITRQIAERAEVQRQVQIIYAQCSMMETQVQSLLLASLEAHNQYTLNVTKYWLRMHKTTSSDSVKQVTTRVIQGM